MALMVGVGVMTQREAAMTTPDFDKPHGERCPHQRHHKGCAIYERRPFGCRMWACKWLMNDDTADLRRPDNSHYVIDCAPDYVEADGKNVPVVQVWLDPGFPDAHHDPALRAFLERRAKEGFLALVRVRADEAFALIAPSLSDTGEWIERHSAVLGPEHTADMKAAVLGPMVAEFTDE